MSGRTEASDPLWRQPWGAHDHPIKTQSRLISRCKSAAAKELVGPDRTVDAHAARSRWAANFTGRGSSTASTFQSTSSGRSSPRRPDTHTPAHRRTVACTNKRIGTTVRASSSPCATLHACVHQLCRTDERDPAVLFSYCVLQVPIARAHRPRAGHSNNLRFTRQRSQLLTPFARAIGRLVVVAAPGAVE